MYKGLRPTFRPQEKVMERISQEQIFYEYLGIYPDLSKRYLSPFRTDKDPGCRFEWRSGILYFVENTRFNDKLYWNCIDIVRWNKQCSYIQALDLLWNKAQPQEKNQKISVVQNKDFVPQIRFEKKAWDDNNLFKLPGKILEKEYVFQVKNYWIYNKSGWQKNSIHDPNKELTIAYYFPNTDHVKLYFPNASDQRWYSTCSIKDIFGYHKIQYYQSISDELIITKSGKDRLILDYHLGKSAIALQNEGCYLPEDIAFELQATFKKITFLYDNDYSGIYHSQKLSEKYNWEYKIIDVIPKDPFDMMSEFGVENTKKLIL